MNACPCGSFAINPNRHGREPGVDTHLCDVCYWRKRAEQANNDHFRGATKKVQEATE